ncbi:RNA ligase family protein [Nocardioides insulae]|uniref:ATP-dependent DNA ligase n=1 Tax=Nocardioides insulae TaxID=394734 RepID=UPI0004227ED9|nr:RNA ligase family protein [Nocardioides insulae]
MSPIPPMLATPGTRVPPGEEWAHEVKWDGVRLVGDLRGDTLRLTTRNARDRAVAWPELVGGAPDRSVVVDGEVIALNQRGLPDFRTLMERMHVASARTAARLAEQVPATYMVFDLLHLDGRDLTPLPWEERRSLLEGLDLGAWQVPPTYDDGAMLLDATRAQGLEGIVSKRRASAYRPGERSTAWLKFAHRFRGSYVVGGWRPQVDSAERLGALLVGEVGAAGLSYRGRVGSGIGAREGRLLRELLTPAETSPFTDEVPRVDTLGTHWCQPLLVVDVETHGQGYDRLRQPAFITVRDDLSPEDLR